jgi:hypothetical protein
MIAPTPVSFVMNCQFSGTNSIGPGKASAAIRLQHIPTPNGPNAALFTGSGMGNVTLGDVTPAVLDQFPAGTQYQVTFTPIPPAAAS